MTAARPTTREVQLHQIDVLTAAVNRMTVAGNARAVEFRRRIDLLRMLAEVATAPDGRR